MKYNILYDDNLIESLPQAYILENPWLIALVKYKKNNTLRSLIEEWFAKLPEGVKPAFYSRLRSMNDFELVPAFYELMAYRYCVEEGWTVEYEPEILPKKTPDLVVTTTNEKKFILEVATLFDSEELAASIKIIREVNEKVSQIKTDWVLDIKYYDYPPSNTKVRVAVAAVRNWLETLDENSPAQGCSFGKAIAGFNFSVNVSKELPTPSVGCLFSVSYPGGQVPDYGNRLKDILNKKNKKYSAKMTGLPLIVLLGDGIGFLRGGTSLIDHTLYGVQQITFGPGKPVAGRDRSGFFTASVNDKGELTGKNTGISGVIYAALREEGSFLMELFHNPVPHSPLPNHIFHKMPQFLLVDIGGSKQMRWITNNPEDSRVRFWLDDPAFDSE